MVPWKKHAQQIKSSLSVKENLTIELYSCFLHKDLSHHTSSHLKYVYLLLECQNIALVFEPQWLRCYYRRNDPWRTSYNHILPGLNAKAMKLGEKLPAAII